MRKKSVPFAALQHVRATASELVDLTNVLIPVDLINEEVSRGVLASQLITGGSNAVYVDDFGAVGDGITDDSSKIQDAIDYCFANSYSHLCFSPGVYVVETGLVLPKGNSGNVFRFVIDGNGATLKTTSPITILSKTISAMSDPVNGNYWNPVIRNLRLVGTASSNGIILHRCGFLVLDGIRLETFDKGIELVFCLESRVQDVDARYCMHTFRVISGDEEWPDGLINNSSSNVTVLEKCRAQTFSASAIGYFVSHCGNVSFRNCVCEGSHVDKAVWIDDKTTGGNGTYRDITFDRFWVEYTTQIASCVFDIDSTASNVKVSGLVLPLTSATSSIVDLSDSSWVTFELSDVSSWGRLDTTIEPFTQDSANTCRWVFSNNDPYKVSTINGAPTLHDIDLKDPSLWLNGIVPHRFGYNRTGVDHEDGWINVDVESENSAWTARGTTPPAVAEGTFLGRENVRKTTFTTAETSFGYTGSRADYAAATVPIEDAVYKVQVDVQLSRQLTGTEEIRIYYTGSFGTESISLHAGNTADASVGWVRFTSGEKTLAVGGVRLTVYQNFTTVSSTLDVYVSNQRLLKKSRASITSPSITSLHRRGVWFELPADDTTPSVLGVSYIESANTGATSYTTFDDGVDGDELHWLMDANSTAVHGATLKLNGASNFTPGANGGMLHLINRNGVWYETGRAAY